MKMNRKKILVPLLVLALVVTTIGGTLAWLKYQTTPVVNTFTVGNVNLTLEESEELDLKMIPGKEIKKDPVVKLTEGSEDAYLFVKVDKTENFDTYMTYGMAAGWTKLNGVSGVNNVWYRTATAGESFKVLLNDKVVVKDSVTNELMKEAGTSAPKLTFTGYAVQKAKDNNTSFTPAEAWAAATK